MADILALAPAPVRATTSITLSFGLLNIPLSVYTGTEATRVERKEFFEGDTSVPVGRAPVRKDTGEVIEQSSVTRMAQAESGAWVPLSDDEIAACTSPRGLAEVVAFVKDKDVPKYLTEDVKQVRPKADKGKVNPAADRAFALLLTTMRQSKVHALVKVAMRGPARFALLDAKGNLFMIYTADAIRETTVPHGDYKFDSAELNLAKMLVETLGTSAPELVDDTAPMVQAYVNDKAKGVTPPPPSVPANAGFDLVSQLQASIDAAKAGKGQVA